MISPQVSRNVRMKDEKNCIHLNWITIFLGFNHSSNDVRVSAQYIYSTNDVICVLTWMLDHAQAHYQLLQMRFDAHLRHETKIE